MFDDEPMSAAMFGALWPMANEVGWERRWAIVGLVASFPEGTWLDGGDVATMVGGNAARARVQLLELTKAKVLERDGGGGGRKFWYRLNPRWRDWRVRWRHDLREVEQRLAWWRERVDRHPLDAISARPNGARYSQISARLMARAAEEWARANDLLARVPMARANPDFEAVDDADQGVSARHGARANGVDSARHGARANSPAAPVVVDLLTRDGEEPSTTEGRPAPKDGPEWGRVRRAVLERCVDVAGRGLFLNGSPARLLRVLVDRHGPDEVIAAAAAVPAGLFGPPVFVDALDDVLEGLTPAPLSSPESIADAPGALDAGPARLTIEAKLARVRQQIANYEAQDCPVPDELRAELDALTGQLVTQQ